MSWRCRLNISWCWRKHTFSPCRKRQGNKRAQNGEGPTIERLYTSGTNRGPRLWYTETMEVNAVGKECSEVERAYIAGFLDADGAIMALIERHQEKRFGFRVRIALKVTQRDPTILTWIQRRIKVGRVRVNRLDAIGQAFDLHILDQKHARLLLTMLRPYLRVKKRQAAYALKILKHPVKSKNDLMYVAHLADTLSQLNVRSKNRRKNFASKIQEHFSPND